MANEFDQNDQQERTNDEIDQELMVLLENMGITSQEIEQAIQEVGNSKLAIAEYFRDKSIREFNEFAKLLIPKAEDQKGLIFGKEYHLWREREYFGIAIWTQDEAIGNSFQRNGELFFADKWELVNLN